MSQGLDRVRTVLAQHGLGGRIRVFEEGSTHTAREAADALGVDPGQIAKSVVFRAARSDRPVVVIARGDRRIDEKVLADWLEEPIERCQPDWVRERTGYSVGGVSPLGHRAETVIVLDPSLWEFDSVYAAAGAPNAVFDVRPEELQAMTGGQQVANISH
ncbi:YbaK/EbsC family protein [Sulfobacillus harzensis]|uniref:YbaK/EbsC family protein n=1 Tax=Sulfobacillus harzensis TaxID=2729629 RepID=A0A7Y0Q3R7_9FIRM|nr:YbaK/EbsC family protein [Sulfobacillus harzensis]NMP22459.1 YbaK/EbsC family protein [Sulfobacillus harzensis]